MKKVLFIITSLLAISTACFAGCNQANPDGDDRSAEKTTNTVLTQTDTQEDKGCKDGDCEKEDGKDEETTIPDFNYQSHERRDHAGRGHDRQPPEFIPDFRHEHRPHHEGSTATTTDVAETDENGNEDDGEKKPHCEQRIKHKKNKDSLTPRPTPLPVQPK